jgi:hypothetical protein
MALDAFLPALVRPPRAMRYFSRASWSRVVGLNRRRISHEIACPYQVIVITRANNLESKNLIFDDVERTYARSLQMNGLDYSPIAAPILSD